MTENARATSAFWGIAAYFNPAGYANKRTHFLAFRQASRRQGLNLLLVELVFGDREPEFDDTAAERYVRIHGDERHLMWQKEALLNIALSRLPRACRHVAWLDADILFENEHWITETAALLEEHVVVQPWSHFVQLPAGTSAIPPEPGATGQESFAHGLSLRGPAWRRPYGRTGSAWAARRGFLEKHGFYDRLILGDADSFMAYGFVGCEDFLDRNGGDFPPSLVRDYRDWASGVVKDVDGRVGVTPGRLLHLWHGEASDRRYRQRRDVLRRHGFDPDRHLARRADGLLKWNNPPSGLRAGVADYFRLRREDARINDPPATKRRVLITGMSGVVGGIVGPAISARYDLRALSLVDIPGVETVLADLRDVAALAPAFDGVDTVVHFAAYCAGDGVRHIDVNIRGSYNLFEAAVAAGVRRVVYISSGAVQQAYEKEEPVLSMVEARVDDVPTPVPVLTHLDPIRPNRMYGVAKACVEIFGRMYAEAGRLSVICLRLGRVRPDNRPHTAREAAVWLSHRDLVQLVEKSIEAPDALRFGIYYGVSDNKMRFRDLAPARDDLGFVPEDGAEAWPDRPVDPPA